MKELALNSLVNLSIAERNEDTIIERGVIEAVLLLLSNSNEKLQQTSAMLLSNLFTNERARFKARNLNWIDALVRLLGSSNLELVTQTVRVIINITFDEHCRHKLVQAGADRHLNSADQRFRNQRLTDLITSALRNISVPINDPSLGGGGGGSSVNVSYTQNFNPPPQNRSSGNLDNILGDISSMNQRPQSTTTAYKPVEVVVNNRQSSFPNSRTSTTPNSRQSTNSDLDDILSDMNTFDSPSTSNPFSKPVEVKVETSSGGGGFDDIDDLLSGMGSSSNNTPPPPPRPVTQRVSMAYKDDFDDIDALISGINNDTSGMDMTSSYKPNNSIPPPPPRSSSSNLDDIDDILADLTPKSNNKPMGKQSMSSGVRSSTTADLNAIDELLADLTI